MSFTQGLVFFDNRLCMQGCSTRSNTLYIHWLFNNILWIHKQFHVITLSRGPFMLNCQYQVCKCVLAAGICWRFLIICSRFLMCSRFLIICSRSLIMCCRFRLRCHSYMLTLLLFCLFLVSAPVCTSQWWRLLEKNQKKITMLFLNF